MNKYLVILLSVFCFVAADSSATMTNLCDGTNGDEDEWGKLDDWSPYPALSFPTSTTDVVLGGGASTDHAAFILNGVNAVCSNLTFGAKCQPHIKSGGTLHVYGDILNSLTTYPVLWIESGAEVTVDGVVNDSDSAYFIVYDGGTFTVNGAGLSRMRKMRVYGSAEVSIPGGVSANLVDLYDNGVLFTNDVTMEPDGSNIRFAENQSGVLTGEVSGAVSCCHNAGFLTYTNKTLILSGAMTSTDGENAIVNQGGDYVGTILITGQSNTRDGKLYVRNGKCFLNESNSAATLKYTSFVLDENFWDSDEVTIGGTAVYDDMRLVVDNAGGGTIDPGYNTGMIGTFGHTGSEYIQLKTNTTLNVDIDGAGAGTNDLLLAGGDLNLYEGCIVNFNVVGEEPGVDEVYVFAEYGALTQQGYFSVTNGLPSGASIDYDYEGKKQIALVMPPAQGTVVSIK